MAKQELERHHGAEPGAADDRGIGVQLAQEGVRVAGLLLDRRPDVLVRCPGLSPAAAIERQGAGMSPDRLDQRIPDSGGRGGLVQEQDRRAGTAVAPGELDSV